MFVYLFVFVGEKRKTFSIRRRVYRTQSKETLRKGVDWNVMNRQRSKLLRRKDELNPKYIVEREENRGTRDLDHPHPSTFFFWSTFTMATRFNKPIK